MNTKNYSHFTTLLSYLFFAILFFLSLFLWKERAIAFDAAYQIFKVIDTGNFAIQVERFGAVVVQALPLVLEKSGASIDLILQSYSISFILYPLLFFALASAVLKNERMGFSIVLFFLIMQVHTFYWIQSELIQGCVFSLFFISVFSKYPKPHFSILIMYSMAALVILYAHPLAIIALFFGMGYLYIDSSLYRNRTFVSLMGVLLLAGLYKYYFASLGSYDTKAFGMFDGFEDRIGNIFSLTSTKFFFERLLTTYYLFPIGFIAVCGFFIKQKNWLKLSWIVLAAVGWLALILTTYHWGTTPFYIESFYLMLGLFISVPIAWDMWPRIQNKWIAPALLATLIIIRVTQIWDGKSIYQDRLDWTVEQLDQMNESDGQRFYSPKSSTPMYLIQMDWSIPYETLLLSSLKQQSDGLKTLYIMQEEDDEDMIIQSRNAFPTGFGLIQNEWVGDRFQMTDSLDVKRLD